jgi:hypothetical protein
MELNQLFDKVYCINLDHRKDRWEQCNTHFTKHGITVDRFPAINGKEVVPNGVGKLLPGEVGVIRSNYNVVKDAKDNNYKQIVIFEDDVELDPEFKEKFFSFYSAVPDNWSFIYMGGNHVGGIIPVNNKVAQIRHSYAIHAICIKNNLFDHILELLKKEKTQVDVTYAQLQAVFPSYVFRPHLAWQKDGFSDIQGGYMNYDFLRRY